MVILSHRENTEDDGKPRNVHSASAQTTAGPTKAVVKLGNLRRETVSDPHYNRTLIG